MFTIIDQNDWPRKEIFDFYSRTSNPFYMVTFTVDVTPVYNYAKQRQLSFYYTMVYVCTKAVNRVPNFLYDVDDGKIIQYDLRHPSLTDLKKGADLFHIVTVDYNNDLEQFHKEVKTTSENQDVFIDLNKEGHNLIFFSCLPWIKLTALTNEHDLANPKEHDDTCPRIAWGQYEDVNGQKTLSLSLEVNHRFIDGYHIGQFNKALTDVMEELQ